MKVAKKIVRIFVIIIVCIILLNIILYLTFSIPSVQKFAADFALDKLKPKLNTEMSIDKIRIKLFNTVEIGGLYVEDQEKDTLLYADKLAARVNIWNLLDNHLSIESVRLDNFTAKVYRETPDSTFNFQFIIDAFAPADTIKKKPTRDPLKISINDIKLSNGTMSYDIFSSQETPGKFNPNHFFVKNFNLNADLSSLDIKHLVADINTLSFDEQKAGVKVDNLQGMVRSGGSKLWSNKVSLTLNNSHLNVSKAVYDLDSKEFSLTAKSDMIEPKDAAIFYDGLSHLNKPFSFDADLEGTIPKAEIKKLSARYGNETAFVISGLITDFSKIDNADINLAITGFKTSEKDLHDFIRIGARNFQSIPQIEALKNIDLTLKAKGKLRNFNVTTRINTAPGTLTFNGTGSADGKFKNMKFAGRLITENLQIAKVIGEEIGVDDLSLNTLAEVNIKKGELPTVSADGNIGSVFYKGYQYRDLAINGLYDGNNSSVAGRVFTDTEENKLNLHADIGFGNQMKFDVRGTIDKLFLSPIITVKKWKNPYLTARINGKFQGKTIDDLVGNVVIDSTSLYDANFIYNPGPIYLQALSADSVGEKKIQLLSSIIEGEVSGNYSFATIGAELMNALHSHLPTLIKEPKKKASEVGTNLFKFNFLLKNTEDISYALSLPFINVEPATISGLMDMVNTKSILLSGYIPRLMFGQSDIRESKIDVNLGALSGAGVSANTYLVQEKGHINARLNTFAKNDSVNNVLFFNMNNDVAKADGSLNVSMGFLRDIEDNLVSNISINPTNTLFNGKIISIAPSTIIYEKEKITVNDFKIRENEMLLLGVDGVASKKREDAIRAFFNNTEIETILAAFNISTFKGSLNGGVTVNQALANPLIQTDNFRIENIRTQTDTIGTLAIEGDWDVIKKGLSLDASIKNNGINYLNINGFVPTGSENPMNVDIKVNELPLAWVQPFAVSTFSQLSGTINSNINLSGKTNAPITEGWLGINEGIMTVAFTNVTYKISDTINISPRNIGLNNLVIKDNNNHEARLNLSLSHDNFDGMSYNASIYMDDFLLLNNERRTDEIAYGTLKLSGNVKIDGSSSGIYGSANLRNESRSNIRIELPQTAQAANYSGIIYINTPQDTDSLSFLRKRDNNTDTRINTRVSSAIPINIQAVLNLNPLFEAGVVINPTTGDALEINGTGQIRANYDSKAVPAIRLYGDYIAEEGKFHYSFQSLKTIEFNIREGSTVTLVGDPMSTQFNIAAYNQVNADLATLSEGFTTQLPNTRTAVNALLEIQGSLEQMNLKYGIELPDASNDVRQRLNSLISTDEQKNRQFASLILTGSFFPAEGAFGVTLGDNIAATLAAGQITKGLDALLAGALNDNWTISTNLQSQDGSFENVRMGVDLSTRLLDDRLRVTTNLSYGDNSTLASQQAFMGEFEMEYDINNWLMIRVYNRANQRFSKRAATTQGAGVVVTRDARTFRDLFRFSFRKKEK
ncbi:MAG: hypothetical protein Q4G63_11520 [Bacteroidia bacterium]|nr:hypothetical protein [Bacteroidia bacterium]